jgi:hypothetical protein
MVGISMVTLNGLSVCLSIYRVFFRRHYPVNSVTFSSIDPQDRRWALEPASTEHNLITTTVNPDMTDRL